MFKKSLIIGAIAAVVLGLLYYGNSYMIRTENKKVQDELQLKINDLQSDKQYLEKKISDIQNAAKQQQTGKIVITDARVQSTEAYNEGTIAGAIYGKFDVAVTVKNMTDTDMYSVKVASIFVKNTVGQKDVGTDPKAQRIDRLAPGEEREVLFTGYKVDHPELSQEVLVSVFHTPSTNASDTTAIKKINIRAAFPPGSQD